MSRIGKEPIKIKDGINVEIKDGGTFRYKTIFVKGPKGELSTDIRRGVKVEFVEGEINVVRDSDSKINRAYHGLYRTLINNMVEGVTDGFKKELEIHGVGYRASMKGNDIELTLGLNHPIVFVLPEGITAKIDKNIDIEISGIDKQLVGETAAKIRELKKPEPYKGKGIRYKGEQIRRKVGKSASA
ncbi:MAG TPA: 50S ribosomal protein L6 [Candidatus Dojkabacteria bacterium]|jgi:large subunit ribosomal protein L6